MADLATLGLAVDSSQVKSAASDLRNFETVAKRTGETVQQVEARFRAASAAAGSMANASKSAAPAQEKYSDATNKVIKRLAEQELRLKMTGREWAIYQNLQRAGVSATSEIGQKIALATGKLYDMEQAQKKASRATDVSATAFRRWLSVFAGGAVVASVGAFARYVWNLRDALAAVGDVAARTNMNAANLQGLGSAAGRLGIGESDFLAGMSKFNLEVDRAKRGTGDLYELLRRNGKAAGTVEETFFKVADLVKNARSEAQKFTTLQQAGLPANEQMVKLMEQGAEALRNQVEAAKANGQVVDQELLNKAEEFNRRWNTNWTNFSRESRAAISVVVDAMDKLYNSANRVIARIAGEGFGGPLLAALRAIGATNETDESLAKLGIRRISPEDGRLQGSFDAIGDLPANRPLQSGLNLAAAKIRGDVTNDAPIKAQKTAFDSAVNSVSRHIAAMNADAAAVGKTAAEHARLRVEAQLVEAGLRSGLSEAAVRSSEKFKELGQAAQEAAQKLALARVNDQIKFDRDTSFLSQQDVGIAQQLRTLYPDVAKALGSVEAQAMRVNDAMRGLSGSIESSISTGLSDLVSGSKSAKDAFSDMADGIVKAIQKMIIQMMIVQPLMKGLQGIMGGIVGPGAPLNILPNALGGVFPANDNGISRYSNQIVSHPTIFPFARGVGLMGEAGPEAIMPLKRAPDGSLGVAAHGGGNQPVVQVNVINQSSAATAEARPNASGGMDVVVRDMVRGVIAEDASSDGPISRMMMARQRGFNGR